MYSDKNNSRPVFDISGSVAVVTGGGGVLGSSIVRSLLQAGARVMALDIRSDALENRITELEAHGEVCSLVCDVLDMDSLRRARRKTDEKWGKTDILINVAGGNIPGATLGENQSVFDMDLEEFTRVNALNLNGTVYPSIVFGESMAESGKGSIINISSMASISAISRVPGYSTAKSGIEIFTKWLASELALKFSERIRVNAIAPGFFIGDQNRAVLINADGSLTERSRKIIDRTPMKRFGDITELNGIIRFLCSDEASFITGAVIPVDGGFSAFSGV
jgi:NAD(P)-dependent dehydrogenase (short-subunit alcohol dehydrogenase family)